MKLIHTSDYNVYTFVLNEDEWYSGTDQQREAWIEQIKREGAEKKATYLNILVQPDETMSISPVSNRHRVYTHASEPAHVENFMDLLQAAKDMPYPAHEVKIRLVKQVFGL